MYILKLDNNNKIFLTDFFQLKHASKLFIFLLKTITYITQTLYQITNEHRYTFITTIFMHAKKSQTKYQ